MPRGTHTRVVKSAVGNKDVVSMFEGMMGSGSAADLKLEIVYPKYKRIELHSRRFLQVLGVLETWPAMSNFPDDQSILREYIATFKQAQNELFVAPDLAKLYPPDSLLAACNIKVSYHQVGDEHRGAFAEAFEQVKTSADSGALGQIAQTCAILADIWPQIKDEGKLQDRFLVGAGNTFAPIAGLPNFNLKRIYISDKLSSDDRVFILKVLRKLYQVSHEAYEATVAPDIDVDEFVAVITASLSDVKKAVPRCNEAFDKIAQSVDLLKGNFNSYYKDFVASKNPSVIMENFVVDVSQSTKASPKLTRQFRHIISHYQKVSRSHAQDPRLKALFSKVDESFAALGETGVTSDASGDASAADPGESGAASAADPGESGAASAADPGESGAAGDASESGAAEDAAVSSGKEEV